MVQISLRLPPNLKERIRILALAAGKSMNAWMVEGIEREIEYRRDTRQIAAKKPKLARLRK